MHPLRLPHDLLLRKHSAPRQSQAKMVALEGLNFKFLALVFKFDILNLNSVRVYSDKDIVDLLYIK